MNTTADAVICGAGIAGICAAWWLTERAGMNRVVIVDERPPLTLTSDKSTEAYRNWWPGPDSTMISFMNRSIDILESLSIESSNRFLMNRRGYLYTTADPNKALQFLEAAETAKNQGAGDVRIYRNISDTSTYIPSSHTGWENLPQGADIFLDRSAIRSAFPWLSDTITAALHARRCGWFSGQQLGMMLLEKTRTAGAEIILASVSKIETSGSAIKAVKIERRDGIVEEIYTPIFINAAGPFAADVSRMIGIELPLFSEMHLKIAFEDELGAVDRNAGLVVLDDEQTLGWNAEEIEDLSSGEGTSWLTEVFPAGVHLRPEGYHQSKTVLALWDYHSKHRYDKATFPLDEDPAYPEVVLRGLSTLVPKMESYIDRLPHCFVDGGYYTKTEDNRPLIGPLDIDGAYVCAAFSGFGMMAAPAAAELLSNHITGSALPSWESDFRLSRYKDMEYVKRVAEWGSKGQL